ncbi:hypothetical protein D043_3331B, partial [Vibrio parahaemolyticus EKP-021]
DAEIRVSP